MKPALHVGVGRFKITPPTGTSLAGYAPGRPAETVHDDLYVTALALESGAEKALLISADLCTYKPDDSRQLRERIQKETDIPSESILFVPTHTHSGPAVNPASNSKNINETYKQNVLEPNVIAAAQAACSRLQDAVVGIGVTRSDIGVNRREVQRDGSIKLGQNPWGPYDPALTVLDFRTPSGTPIANLVHYGCHGTGAGKNSEITRDWPGPMVNRLEEESGAVTVFFNGAIGDVGPRLPNGKTTGTLSMAQALGARAGLDAVRAWRSIKEYRPVSLRTVRREIALPRAPLPSLESARQERAGLDDPGDRVGMKRTLFMKQRMRLESIIRERESGRPLQTHFHLEQVIVSLGPIAFVPFPYELFSEITLRIRMHSPFPHTLCLSNANGSLAYFPTPDQISRGGYEIRVARVWQMYVLDEHADTAAVEESLRSLETLMESRKECHSRSDPSGPGSVGLF